MQLFIFLDLTGDFDVLAGSAEFLMNLGVGVILVEWETEPAKPWFHSWMHGSWRPDWMS